MDNTTSRIYRERAAPISERDHHRMADDGCPNEPAHIPVPRPEPAPLLLRDGYPVCPHCNFIIDRHRLHYDGRYWYHEGPCRHGGETWSGPLTASAGL